MNEKVIAFGAFHPVPSFLFLMSLIVIAVFMANPVAVGILLLGALLFPPRYRGENSSRISHFILCSSSCSRLQILSFRIMVRHRFSF